jgi:hypothetical protein
MSPLGLPPLFDCLFDCLLPSCFVQADRVILVRLGAAAAESKCAARDMETAILRGWRGEGGWQR